MAVTQTQVRAGPLLIETAAMPKEGEDVSGDRACTGRTEDAVLVGVVDGLGHGADACAAAERAARVIEEPPAGATVTTVLERCHEALRGTRGAVIALAAFGAHTADMEWLAVGNVEGILVRSGPGRPRREALVQRPGIVGHNLPPLRSTTLPVKSGDTLVFATDGVRREIVKAATDRTATARPSAALELLREFAAGNDDALLLTARYEAAT